jgi:hypothetical protein
MSLNSMSIALVSLVGITMSSCGHERVQSAKTADIASPGQVGEDNALIWMDQGKVFVGQCVKGSPVSRANCGTNTTQRSLEETRKSANDNALAESRKVASDVDAETKRLKDSDPSITSLRNQVATLANQKQALTSSTDTVSASLKLNQGRKVILDRDIEDRNGQIAAIDKRLAQTPNDEDLMALRAQLVAERSLMVRDLGMVSAQIDTLTRRLAWENQQLADVTSKLTAAEKVLQDTYDTLIVTSDALVTLNQRMALIQAATTGLGQIFDYISRADIVYRGQLFSRAQQLALTWIVTQQVTLDQGRYVVESGHTSFCPQQVRTQYANGVLAKVTLSYLSPCSGTTNEYLCINKVCSFSSSRVVTVLSRDHYRFKDGSDEAIFKFERAEFALDEGVAAVSPAELRMR